MAKLDQVTEERMSENNNVTGVMEEEHQRLKRGYWKHTEAHEGFCLKKKKRTLFSGLALVVPWLRLRAFIAGGMGSIPRGTIIPYAAQPKINTLFMTVLQKSKGRKLCCIRKILL